MNQSKSLFCITLSLVFSLAAPLYAENDTPSSWNRTWWNPATGEQVLDPYTELVTHDIVVLGETHYDLRIHLMQGHIISQLGQPRPNGEEVTLTVGWEFLNRSDRNILEIEWNKFLASQENGIYFAARLAGREAAVYGPIFTALRGAKGQLIPTNLSRAEKSPVTRGGISAADPSLIPPGYEAGSSAYYDRFLAAMGVGQGHPASFPVDNYFEAHSLTDDVMAYSLAEAWTGKNRMALITGSFHSDYNDGVVARLKARIPSASVLNVRILSATSYTKDELLALFNDKTYGPLADLVVIVGEPKVK